MVGAADEGHGAVVAAPDFGKRSSGEVCWAIFRAVVEDGDRVVAGEAVEASAAVALVAVAVVVLAVGLVAEIVLVEAVQVAVGRPSTTLIGSSAQTSWL